jgi:hypothetical protein
MTCGPGPVRGGVGAHGARACSRDSSPRDAQGRSSPRRAFARRPRRVRSRLWAGTSAALSPGLWVSRVPGEGSPHGCGSPIRGLGSVVNASLRPHGWAASRATRSGDQTTTASHAPRGAPSRHAWAGRRRQPGAGAGAVDVSAPGGRWGPPGAERGDTRASRATGLGVLLVCPHDPERPEPALRWSQVHARVCMATGLWAHHTPPPRAEGEGRPRGAQEREPLRRARVRWSTWVWTTRSTVVGVAMITSTPPWRSARPRCRWTCCTATPCQACCPQ